MTKSIMVFFLTAVLFIGFEGCQKNPMESSNTAFQNAWEAYLAKGEITKKVLEDSPGLMLVGYSHAEGVPSAVFEQFIKAEEEALNTKEAGETPERTRITYTKERSRGPNKCSLYGRRSVFTPKHFDLPSGGSKVWSSSGKLDQIGLKQTWEFHARGAQLNVTFPTGIRRVKNTSNHVIGSYESGMKRNLRVVSFVRGGVKAHTQKGELTRFSDQVSGKFTYRGGIVKTVTTTYRKVLD